MLLAKSSHIIYGTYAFNVYIPSSTVSDVPVQRMLVLECSSLLEEDHTNTDDLPPTAKNVPKQAFVGLARHSQ